MTMAEKKVSLASENGVYQGIKKVLDEANGSFQLRVQAGLANLADLVDLGSWVQLVTQPGYLTVINGDQWWSMVINGD